VSVLRGLLAHGGLVPAQNHVDPIGEVIPRLDVLRELDAPVTAFGVVTRLPTYDDPGRSRQEPEYWASHGERLGALSTVWAEQQPGEVDDDAVAAARACVPAGHRRARTRPPGRALAPPDGRRPPLRAGPARNRSTGPATANGWARCRQCGTSINWVKSTTTPSRPHGRACRPATSAT